MTPAVTLSTERMILRQPQASDLTAYQNYCASPRSAFVGGPFDEAKAFEKFAAMIGHWSLRGFGRYVMTLNDRPIGHVGPMQIDSDVVPEFTWTLWDGESERQGFAIEAAAAVQNHLMQDCAWTRMIIRIMPDNIGSCKIAERIGATLSTDAAPAWYPGCLTYYLVGTSA